MIDASNTSKGQPGLAVAALFGLCPRRGQSGLDYSRFNVGYGPAAFLTLGVGALVVGLALWVELVLAPPFRVHVVLWLPLVLMLFVASLRLIKGALLMRECQSRAEQHRHDGSDLS